MLILTSIEFKILNSELEIKIKENPIIQTISINGIKNKAIVRQLEEITRKSEKYPFLISNVKEQRNLLLNIVRAGGFYFAEVKTRIIENDNNSIDLEYEFILGLFKAFRDLPRKIVNLTKIS